ncbi:hypothetical protein LguiA_031921 [Lonicera macranthoides]
MAGNARFQLTSASSELGFAGNYPNEKRRNHYGPSMDRSGSFREGVESRMFGSGVSISRGNGSFTGDLPPLSQCLFLEPIVMGDQKFTRSGELRRVMGFSGGCSSEDNSFGAAHLKPSPPLAMEDLKRFISSVIDTCKKARGRAKKLDEHLHKLTKYCDAITSKKQQRNEILTNERSNGLNLKMGALIHRNPPDLVSQKLEDRPKNVLLNKRVRTSVAETRAECQSNGLTRHALVTAKDRDLLKDSGADSDQVEEKIRRLPAGGEGWDKKRKRSVGTVLSRPIDSEGELKRPMYHKLSSEPAPTPCDTSSFRSGASNGAGGINKLDGTSVVASSNTRGMTKMEHERAATPKDLADGLNKERHPLKGSNKLKNLEENHISGPAAVTKGKASRASRSGSIGAANSSPNIPHVSGTPEDLEHTPSVNKIPTSSGAHHRKRAMSSGSSSPPRTQWGGRRPQKISRTRRANLVSPVSSLHDEMQIPSEGCSPSDFGARLASSGPTSSLPSRSAANGSQQFKIKIENVQSPARLSESDESGAIENRLKEKASVEVEEKTVNAVQNGGPSAATLTKKNKFLIKDENGDGVQRQGRSGRGSSFSRVGMSSVREKVDKISTTKPFRSARPGSEKNGSKSGRPLKKLSDRKSFSRLGHMQSNGSPETTGEFDDREELLAAANFAHSASYLACSSPFWKRMEPTFASISLDDKSYLSQQLKFAEELQGNLPQISGQENNVLGDLVQEETFAEELVDHCEEAGSLFGNLDFEITFNKVTPLYQRVLSALIVEDEIEDYEEINVGRSMSVQNTTCGFPYDTLIEAEPRKRDGMEFECDSMLGMSSFDCQYEQMGLNDKLLLELQSIDLYPDVVPNLDDKEDEMITQQIVQLKKGLDQQIGKRKTCLDKLYKAIGSTTEARDLEQVAMDKLVELSYKKLLATRGNSRGGVAKVPKQVALGFARRTLTRCRKFEDSGTSCFSDPALRDIIFGPPSWANVAEPLTSKSKHLESRNLAKASSGGLSDSYEMFTHLSDEAFAKNGPISNRGKKKEVLLDDFASGTPLRATSNLASSTLLGGTKGKRSERERDGIPKAGPGRPSQGNYKGERKTKMKPKQKTAQLSTSLNGIISKFTETREDRLISAVNNISQDLPREITNLPLNDLDPIEELGVSTDIGNGHEDLSSLLNFEDDGLQEHFSAGLEIPMDDLSGLNMF